MKTLLSVVLCLLLCAPVLDAKSKKRRVVLAVTSIALLAAGGTVMATAPNVPDRCRSVFAPNSCQPSIHRRNHRQTIGGVMMLGGLGCAWGALN